MAATFVLAGRSVDRVGYGAMRLNARPPDFQAAIPVLRRAVELGVNHIDTSDYYGPGTVNQAIRAALHPYLPELLIATKVGWALGPDGLRPAYSDRDLVAGIEGNLRHLGLDALDLVNFRLDDRAHANPASLDAPFETLVRPVEQGKIKHLGISNANLDQVRHAHTHAHRGGAEPLQSRQYRGRRPHRGARWPEHRLRALLPPPRRATFR